MSVVGQRGFEIEYLGSNLERNWTKKLDLWVIFLLLKFYFIF